MTLDFPAGIACADFPLRAEAWGFPRVFKEFDDHDGMVVRILVAGLGSDLRMTNMDTGMSVWFRAKGSTWTTLPAGDGTSTLAITGHSVVFMYPTDHPAGPSSTLYAGRVACHVIDATQEFTLLTAAGKQTDICAALSS